MEQKNGHTGEEIKVEVDPSGKEAKISLFEDSGAQEDIEVHTNEKIQSIDIIENGDKQKVEIGTENEVIDISVHDKHHETDITVLVNKKPVKFHNQKQANGAQIKAQAIKQGVPIQQDFNLFEKEAGGNLKSVGDDETVKLHRDQQFRAVAPDDNSQQ